LGWNDIGQANSAEILPGIPTTVHFLGPIHDFPLKGSWEKDLIASGRIINLHSQNVLIVPSKHADRIST
jgi:hypothetical protein